MDLKQIKLIIDLMKRSDLTEFEVEEEGFKLKIARNNNGQPIVQGLRGSNAPFIQGIDTIPPIPLAAVNGSQIGANPGVAAAPVDEPGITYVKSPMVGTFYRSPTPESTAFVDVGSKIVENSVVCTIEAMKIMNEIQAETKGTIIELLLENGQPVEYGQKIYKVKQA